jgi:hypothetical protein
VLKLKILLAPRTFAGPDNRAIRLELLKVSVRKFAFTFESPARFIAESGMHDNGFVPFYLGRIAGGPRAHHSGY